MAEQKKNTKDKTVVNPDPRGAQDRGTQTSQEGAQSSERE